MTEDDRLVEKDLIWHPGERPPTKDQMSAIRNRHHYAIQPIPAGTALGHDHLMAHADRGTLLREVDRLSASHADCQPEAWAAAARVARELRTENERLRLALVQAESGAQVAVDGGVAYLQEVKRLEGVMDAFRAIHAPVEVPQVGKCCKANHGVAWKRWPCREAELLDMEGRPL